MKMFNEADIQERIGDTYKKSKTLLHLEDCEKEFIRLANKYKLEWEYDCVAMELPYFKTIAYTEYAHTFMIKPLQNEIRYTQWIDAYNDNIQGDMGWMDYWADRINRGEANKYANMVESGIKPRKAIAVLLGSNKLKEVICANKMCFLRDRWYDDIYFKPHPLTTYQLIGELKDMLGGKKVLDREIDLHPLLLGAEYVYTSHWSESAMYAVALDKKIDPIDVYNKVHEASFYHINSHLFREKDPKAWMTRALNSSKSGMINPELDSNWKQRMAEYFEYVMDWREDNRYKYVYNTGGTIPKPKKKK